MIGRIERNGLSVISAITRIFFQGLAGDEVKRMGYRVKR